MLRNLPHIIEYTLLRLVELKLCVLPRGVALLLGSAAGSLLYYLGVKRHVVRINFEHVGLWNPADARAIQKRLYRNMGRYMADFLRSSKKTPPYVVHNLERIEEHLSRGKGFIALLAHFGSWEILAHIYGSRYPLHVVARPMKNPFVEKWLWRRRAGTGSTPIYRKKALRQIFMLLRSNNIVAMLIDQYAGRDGTTAPFLGKPASTLRAPAGMLLKTECGILPTYALLRDDNVYEIVLQQARDLGVSRDNPEAFMDAYQAEHNRIISEWIRQHPDHYFGWFHKRFKKFASY